MKPPKKRRDLKILWGGDAVWSQSGYGCEMDWIIRRLLKDGWQVAQSAKAGLHGHWIDYRMDEGTLRMYPMLDDQHGSDMLFYGAKHFGAHIAISMIDIWVIQPQFIQQLKQNGIKYWVYIPIDSTPPSPGVLRVLPLVDKIITFSKFGQKELLKHGFASEMIYEGVDLNFLKPRDKMEMRKKMGIPPTEFLFGMIAANKENPPRKSFQEVLEAFKMFLDVHPEAGLFFHTQQISGGSFPIRDYANYLKIGQRCFFLDQLFSSVFATRDDIVDQYSALDAYLMPSQTEGFGLTAIEAQAIGKPVITSTAHSMPELIIPDKTGALVETNSRWFHNMLSFWERPDPKSIYDAMEKIYTMVKENPEQVAKDCREYIEKTFNIDTIFKDRWLPLIERTQIDILGKSVKMVTDDTQTSTS